jgi:hypothetical protein
LCETCCPDRKGERLLRPPAPGKSSRRAAAPGEYPATGLASAQPELCFGPGKSRMMGVRLPPIFSCSLLFYCRGSGSRLSDKSLIEGSGSNATLGEQTGKKRRKLGRHPPPPLLAAMYHQDRIRRQTPFFTYRSRACNLT